MACLLLSGIAAVGSKLQKKQNEGGDECQNQQATNCQNALNSDDNERFCDGNCMEVLTQYSKCLGYQKFLLYRDEECGAFEGTAIGFVVFMSTLLVSLVAALY